MILQILITSILTILIILCLELFVYAVIVKKLKNMKSDELTTTSTSPQDIKKYFDVDNYFLKKIDDEATKFVNIKVANDKIAQTSSISQNEVLEMRNQIIDNVISSIPVPFLEIIDILYTRPQIMLICTNVLIDKLLSYYTIYSNSQGGVNK